MQDAYRIPRETVNFLEIIYEDVRNPVFKLLFSVPERLENESKYMGLFDICLYNTLIKKPMLL